MIKHASVGVVGSCIVSIVLFSNPLLSMSISIPKNPETCTIPGLYGTFPIAIQNTINYFIEAKKRPLRKVILQDHRLLLYGPSGTGKSTVAIQIARLTDSELIVIDFPDLLSRFQNSGAEKIKEVFEEVLRKCASSRRGVVLVVEEIDAMAAPKDDKGNFKDRESAFQSFWRKLDINNPRLLVIATTNNIEALPGPLKNRFSDQNTIKLDKPTIEQRTEIIFNSYLRHSEPASTTVLLEKLIEDKTKEKDSVFIGKFAGLFDKLLSLLNNIDLKVQVLDFLNKDRIKTQKQKNEILALVSKAEALNARIIGYLVAAKPKDEQDTANNQLFMELLNSVKANFEELAVYLDTDKKIISEAILKKIVAETAGFSGRTLTELIQRLRRMTKKTGSEVISAALLDKEIKNARRQYIQENRKSDDQINKELERLNKLLTTYDLVRKTLSEDQTRGHIFAEAYRSLLGGKMNYPNLKQVLDVRVKQIRQIKEKNEKYEPSVFDLAMITVCESLQVLNRDAKLVDPDTVLDLQS